MIVFTMICRAKQAFLSIRQRTDRVAVAWITYPSSNAIGAGILIMRAYEDPAAPRQSSLVRHTVREQGSF